MPDLDAFAWADGVEAVCVAVAGGCTEDELIDRYGGDPAAAVPASPDNLEEWTPDGGPVLLVRSVRGLVLAIEDNGWQGTRPEVLREVTAGGGRMISAFWNVNALSEINLAEAGAVLTTFEDAAVRSGADPDRLLPVLGQIGYPAEALGPRWKEWMLALVGAVTGVDVDAAVMDGPFRAVRLAPLPADLPARDGLAASYLRRTDPEVSAALDAATDGQLRRAAVAGARQTLAVAGLDRQPALLAALDGAERGQVGAVDRRSPLGRLLSGRELADDRPPAADPDEAKDRATWRELATSTVRAALAPDPLVAAHEAASQGRVYLAAGAPARAAMLAALRGA